MNFDDLWIGDEVYVSSLNKNARWEGKGEGRAKIRHGELLIWVPLSEISEARIFHEKKGLDSGTARRTRSASASSASPPWRTHRRAVKKTNAAPAIRPITGSA